MYVQFATVPFTTPKDEIAASVDAYYGEGVSAALMLDDLAALLDGDQFVARHTDATEDSVETWKLSSDDMKLDTYYGFWDYVDALIADESWTSSTTTSPSWTPNALVFTHTSGLVVKVFYDYKSSYGPFYGYIQIEIGNEPEPEPVVLPPSAQIANAELEGNIVTGIDFSALDAELEGTSFESAIYYNYHAADFYFSTATDITDDQLLAAYNAVLSVYLQVLAAAEADPEHWDLEGDYSYYPEYPTYGGYIYTYDPITYTDDDGREVDFYFDADMSASYHYATMEIVYFGDFYEPLPVTAGSLAALFTSDINNYLENYGLDDVVELKESACLFTFESVYSDENEYVFASQELETAYQVACCIDQLLTDLKGAGFQVIIEDNESGTYWLAAGTEQGGCMVMIDVGMNQQTGKYQVYVDMMFFGNL